MSEKVAIIPHVMTPENFGRLFRMSNNELFAERSRCAHAYTTTNPHDEALRHSLVDVYKVIKAKKQCGMID